MGGCSYHDPKLDESCTCTEFVPNPDNPRQCWDCRHYLTAHGGGTHTATSGASSLLSSGSAPKLLSSAPAKKKPQILDVVRSGQRAGGLAPAEDTGPSSSSLSSARTGHTKQSAVEETLKGYRKQAANLVAHGPIKKKSKNSNSSSHGPTIQKEKGSKIPINLLVMLECGASDLTTTILKPDQGAVQQLVVQKLAVRGPDKSLTFKKSDDYEDVSSWLCHHIPAAAALIAQAAEAVEDECPLVLLFRKNRDLKVWMCKDGGPTGNDLELAKGNITQSYKNHEIWFTYRRQPTEDEIRVANEDGNRKGKKRARSPSMDTSNDSSPDTDGSIQVRYKFRPKRGKSQSTDGNPVNVNESEDTSTNPTQAPETPLFIASTPGSLANSTHSVGFGEYSLGLDGFELAELEEILNDPKADMSDTNDQPSSNAGVTTGSEPGNSASVQVIRPTTPPSLPSAIVTSPPKLNRNWAHRFLKPRD